MSKFPPLSPTSCVAQWLRHPPVETLVVPGSDPDLAKNLFLHFFLTKMNTVQWAKSSALEDVP